MKKSRCFGFFAGVRTILRDAQTAIQRYSRIGGIFARLRAALGLETSIGNSSVVAFSARSCRKVNYPHQVSSKFCCELLPKSDQACQSMRLKSLAHNDFRWIPPAEAA